MLVLVGSIIGFVFLYMNRQNEQRQKLAKLNEEHTRTLLVASVETQEQVRRQIGGDLHDDIGTLLSATRLSLKQLGKQINSNEKVHVNYEQTLELLNDALSNVRRISKDLMPSTLDEFGLIDALNEFTNKMSTSTGINISFEKNDLQHERFEHKTELIFFRIAQELTNNSLKHSQAKNIEINLKFSEQKLCMTVADDGVGFDLSEVMKNSGKGIGLSNIEGRLSLIKGTVTFDVAKGKGSKITVCAMV